MRKLELFPLIILISTLFTIIYRIPTSISFPILIVPIRGIKNPAMVKEIMDQYKKYVIETMNESDLFNLQQNAIIQ